MKKPTRTELFEGLLGLASADGRGDALFGDTLAQARVFFERSLIGDSFPAIYLEFPLAGEPCLDLLALYYHVAPGSRFAPGAGYGHQRVFDWYSCLEDREKSKKSAIGIELDLSRNVTDQAGIYLQQDEARHLVRPFFEQIGKEGRADAYIQMAERMPRGWAAAYAGLFPGRPGTPVRLGGYLSEPSRRRCAEDPAFLASRFDLMGFGTYDTEMLELCSQLMGSVPAIDFQFDLLADGSLGDTFGLSLSFGRLKPSEVPRSFSSGYAAAVMKALEDRGLADERWRLIPHATCARTIEYQREDGSPGHLALCILLNYAKVKFVRGAPQTAKFYLVASAFRA